MDSFFKFVIQMISEKWKREISEINIYDPNIKLVFF